MQVCREEVPLTPKSNLLHFNASNCIRHIALYLNQLPREQTPPQEAKVQDSFNSPKRFVLSDKFSQ
jgi:hypothetical protein